MNDQAISDMASWCGLTRFARAEKRFWPDRKGVRQLLMSEPIHSSAQVNRDEDCFETALRLMDLRRQMIALIGQRNAPGGRERMLNVEERLKADYRALNPKSIKGAQGRRG